MYNNVLVVGDFNLHLNKADPDAEVFENSMDSLGLVPHVKFPKHNLGNTLYQLYSELNGASIHNCHQGPALSDHYSVDFDTSIACSSSCATCIKIRNLKDMNYELLKEDLHLTSVITKKLRHQLITSTQKLSECFKSMPP